MRPTDLTDLPNKISKGVLDMRIGTALTIFLVILIGSGYVLSDDLHVREDLAKVEGDLVEQAQQVELLQENLVVCENIVIEAQQENLELRNQITVLNESIVEREAAIASLEGINKNLAERIVILDAQKTEAERRANSIQSRETPIEFQGATSILLIAIVIAQIVLSVVLASGTKLKLNNPQVDSDYVRLTPKERSLIVRYRRSQKA